MDFDEVQRSMEFLLAQQAQFAADLQQARELLHQSRELSDQRHAQISDALIGAMAFGGILAESDRQLGRRMAELSTAHKETEASLKELHKAQKVTEASLSALMLTVERHLREDHGSNGRDQP
jgi:hypothetical protein